MTKLCSTFLRTFFDLIWHCLRQGSFHLTKLIFLLISTLSFAENSIFASKSDDTSRITARRLKTTFIFQKTHHREMENWKLSLDSRSIVNVYRNLVDMRGGKLTCRFSRIFQSVKFSRELRYKHKKADGKVWTGGKM